MADALLDLSTTDFDRPVVRIDGQDYEMRTRDELAKPELLAMARIQDRLEELQDRSDASNEDQMVLLLDVLGEQVQLVLIDLPDDVLEKLTTGMRKRILDTFTQLGAAEQGPPSADTKSSSAGSTASTAAA